MARNRFILSTEEIVRKNFEEQKILENSLASKPNQPKAIDLQKRENFRIWWTGNKRKYGETKGLEEIIWLHLVSSGYTDSDKFEAGCEHFGLKKV
jgi:hypothetical protein